jgi:hypothetical protein
MPIKDRIRGLLLSDLKNLFHYEKYRHAISDEEYIDDVFDTPVYMKLKERIRNKDADGVPIFLQICWDGATMFQFVQGPSMYPTCYSIMNFPPSMRNKVNVGLHVASFCNGCDASQKVLGEELLNLYDNPIVVDGVRYYVMVAQILMDGPGRTAFCKCRSTTSHDGCPLCDVNARSFGKGRRVYDSFRRYLPADDLARTAGSGTARSVRMRDRRGNINLWYTEPETRPFPKNRLVIYCYLLLLTATYCF